MAVSCGSGQSAKRSPVDEDPGAAGRSSVWAPNFLFSLAVVVFRIDYVVDVSSFTFQKEKIGHNLWLPLGLGPRAQGGAKAC